MPDFKTKNRGKCLPRFFNPIRMTTEQYDLIKGILVEELDRDTAIFMHLKHQLSLPQKHRIDPTDEDLMLDNVKVLRNTMRGLTGALNSLELDYTKLISNEPKGSTEESNSLL